jgi:hypothetical protein
MRRIALGLTVLVVGLASPAFAKHHHGTHHHAGGGGLYVCSGCVVKETKAGPVAVSASDGNKLVEAINALWDEGFRGPVHCAAPNGTHVRHSLHHTGRACDMAQTGWGRSAAKIMYHASAILARFGVNDGCTFRDCGHISVGVQEAGLHHRHYAKRYHARYAHFHHRHYASRV